MLSFSRSQLQSSWALCDILGLGNTPFLVSRCVCNHFIWLPTLPPPHTSPSPPIFFLSLPVLFVRPHATSKPSTVCSLQGVTMFLRSTYFPFSPTEPRHEALVHFKILGNAPVFYKSCLSHSLWMFMEQHTRYYWIPIQLWPNFSNFCQINLCQLKQVQL